MLSISSFMPVKILSGTDCLSQHFDIIKNLGSRCFIITGRNSARISGALDDLIILLNKNNVSYNIFDEIEPNPLTETCYKAGKCAREFKADYIVGIGGGSVLDAAKAVAIYRCNGSMLASDIYNRQIPSSHVPVVLIGTTSGTGSEVTGVSVLTNSDNMQKKSISGIDCYADYSFCDYKYTKTANTFTRKSTCYDALAHALESYVASTSNDLSQLYATKAIGILSEYILSDNFADLSDNDFEKLYIASLYAGLAINITGTCFPHTVGYFLTEKFGVPHGIACALLMPDLLERIKNYCPEKLRAIEKLFDCNYEDLISTIKQNTKTSISITVEDIMIESKRWDCNIKNFARTPGGFNRQEAESCLIKLIS